MSIRKAVGVLAVAGAAFALSAGTAQAANSVYLYTSPLSHCQTTGDNGVAGGVFTSYTCTNGFAGYSLSVTPKSGSVSNVYLNTFGSAFGNIEDCAATGQNGVNGGVFSSYHCQIGFTGYSLSVTG